MAIEEKKVTLTQEEDDHLSLDHGGVSLYGDKEKPALMHQLGGHVVHATAPQQPLVHLVCWGEQEEACKVDVAARVTLAGDEKQPLHVRMHHHFENEHKQSLDVNPLEHALNIDSTLSKPIHHALQLRTPLKLSFCNPWHFVSDYIMDIRMGKNQVISLRLTGATVATPKPCPDDACPPIS